MSLFKNSYAALALVLASSNFVDAQNNYLIAGTVVDSSSNQPIANATVFLDLQGQRTGDWVKTDREGKFCFPGRVQGLYSLAVQYRGVIQPFGQKKPGLASGVGILAGPGQETSDLVVRWFRPGSISGKVLDDNHEPLESALVQVVRMDVVRGVRKLTSIGSQPTDDLGRFRFGGLNGGSYFLAVTFKPAEGSFISALANSELRNRAYQPVLFPQAPSTDPEGKAILIKPGEDKSFEFRLIPVQGVDLMVTHVIRESALRASIQLIHDGTAGGVRIFQATEWSSPSDVSELQSVPPGRYLIRYRVDDRKTPILLDQPVNVSGENKEMEVSIIMPKMATIAGSVSSMSGRPPRRAVALVLSDSQNRFAVNIPVTWGRSDSQGGGALVSQEILPGEYRLQLANADGFYLRDVLQLSGAGVDKRRGVIAIPEGGSVNLRLEMGTDLASVRGHVRGADAAPQPGALVVLAGSHSKWGDAHIESLQSDSDGSFQFFRVPAGEYALVAVDNLDLEYDNETIRKRLWETGRKVTVSAGGVITGQEVTVTPESAILDSKSNSKD
jgi:hypothetical protein